MASYHLWSTRGRLRDSKIGFCFFDTNARYLSLPRPRARAATSSPAAARAGRLRTRSGISVGWGDKYPWNFAYQWIDITGLPSGHLHAPIRWSTCSGTSPRSARPTTARTSGSRSAASTVRVLGGGSSCVNDYSDDAPTPPTPAGGSARGCRPGCDPMLFCTYNMTQRDELAVFISRLLRPAGDDPGPASTTTTARGSSRTINRVGLAGIMTGCGVREVLPDAATCRARPRRHARPGARTSGQRDRPLHRRRRRRPPRQPSMPWPTPG